MLVRHSYTKKLVSVTAICVAALFATAGPAGAGSISYDSYTVVNSQTVTISGPLVNESGGSGQIDLFSGPGQTGTEYLTWCIDIYNFLVVPPPPETYTETFPPTDNGNPVSSSTNKLSTNQISEIGALMDWGNAHIGANSDNSSATQLAIWMIEYAGTGETFTVADSATNTLAGTLVADAIAGGPGFADDESWDMLAGSGSQGLGFNQGLAFKPPLGVPVPEPATLALLGLGLAGLGFSRRRKAG